MSVPGAYYDLITPHLNSPHIDQHEALVLIAHHSDWCWMELRWQFIFPTHSHFEPSGTCQKSQVLGSGVSRLSVRCYVSVSSWGPYVMSSVQCSHRGYLLLVTEHRQERARQWPGEKRGLQSCEKHHEDKRVMTLSDDDDEQ